MLCSTIKPGTDCGFMTKKGCSYAGGSCKPVIDSCLGCNKIVEFESGNYCKLYPEPATKWLKGKCPSASHVKLEIKEVQAINPLKASKRASKKK
ncbi:PxxKW family cysteine-rich protein [Syntrophus buswellii]|uniref:PxxKW family cysteine-rich protein n=1 Tax=Syntrophus buswellii TaxID=43774 RepID=UPI0038D38736